MQASTSEEVLPVLCSKELYVADYHEFVLLYNGKEADIKEVNWPNEKVEHVFIPNFRKDVGFILHRNNVVPDSEISKRINDMSTSNSPCLFHPRYSDKRGNTPLVTYTGVGCWYHHDCEDRDVWNDPLHRYTEDIFDMRVHPNGTPVMRGEFAVGKSQRDYYCDRAFNYHSLTIATQKNFLKRRGLKTTAYDGYEMVIDENKKYVALIVYKTSSPESWVGDQVNWALTKNGDILFLNPYKFVESKTIDALFNC